MKRSLYSALLCSLSIFVHQVGAIDNNDPFAELDQAIADAEGEGSDAEMAEFLAWKQQHLADYKAFRLQHYAQLDAARDKLLPIWGESELSNKSKFVQYSDDLNTRTVLNYESNSIEVSVVHDADVPVSVDTLSKVLEQNVVKSGPLNQPASIALQLKEAQITSHAPSDKASLNDVYEKESYKIKQQANAQKQQVEKMYDGAPLATPDIENSIADSIAKETAQIDRETTQRLVQLAKVTKKPKATQADKEALKKKKITTFKLKMSNQKEIDKARAYIAEVTEESKRWGLQPSLMFAIMHTESYFNPRAQSHVPAYGLMQIVPTTAGVDVNRFLFNKNSPMNADYLYQSDQNIEAGIAYLHLLNSRYLKSITNPQSRLYCIIAAYNTGAGNVAKAFNKSDSRSVNRAAPIINEMTPEQVYQHLLDNLPYDETRHYLKKVVSRQSIYSQLESQQV